MLRGKRPYNNPRLIRELSSRGRRFASTPELAGPTRDQAMPPVKFNGSLFAHPLRG